MRLSVAQLDQLQRLKFAVYDAFGTPEFKVRCAELEEWVAAQLDRHDQAAQLAVRTLGERAGE